MKRRRILALLLALSISMSMNGLTVLAESPDPAVIPATVAEDESTGDEKEDSAGGQKAGTSGETTKDAGSHGETTEDQSDAEQSDVESSEETDSDQPEETEPDEDDTRQPDEVLPEEGDDEQPGEMPPEEGDDEQPEDKDTQQPTDEEDSDWAENPDKNDMDVSVSDNTLGADSEDQKEESGELPGKAEQTVKMMTFTDDTGMRITYNANKEYNLVVTDGVLEGIVYEDGSAVKGVVVIPEGKGITAIGTAFKGNKDITYVKMPSGVTAIHNGAFSDCSSMEGAYLPNGIRTIGDSAFESCGRLLKIAVPKSVESIGNRAFYQNSSLFMVYMQDADYSELVSIGDQAFYQCGKLENFGSDSEFVIPGKLESVGAWAFYECKSIRELDFQESIKTIGENAFQRCTGLESVILSSKLENIPARAFAGCSKMLSVQFKKGNKTIGVAAFEGCNQLGHVDLIMDIVSIGSDAFSNCGGLVSVRVRNGHVVIGSDAFPDDNDPMLILIGDKDSTAWEYAKGKNICFVIADTGSAVTNYYKYTTTTMGVVGGKLVIRDANGKDPNTLNDKQGVPYGTELFVTPEYGEGIALRAGSVKCNGVVLNKASNGAYSFIMPVGGAYITAEFVNKSDTKTQGIDEYIKVKVSNGEAETNDEGNVRYLKLKVGQYSRVFLTDENDDNRTIAASKIKFTSDRPTVVSIKGDGTIQALKAGTAVITAKVTDANDKEVTRNFPVNVTGSRVSELKIKAVEWDASCVKLGEEAGTVQSVLIDVNDLTGANAQDITFKLRATAYDEAEDKVSVPLKWSSSDSKVAKLTSASTTVNSTDNTITVPQGTSGEATIRVTATIDQKTTVTQKFIVRVIDTTPRLAQKNITVNPNLEDGARLQIISAYGGQVNTNRVSPLYDANTGDPFGYLKVDLLPTESDNTVSTFRLTPLTGLKDGPYSLKVNVGNGKYLPLTVTVKTSEPKAKISFQKKQPKKNLFYADDGTEFVVNVSNLGKVEVSDFELQPLNETNTDDQKFLENFEVEYVDKASCIIRQRSAKLQCAEKGTNKGKPVVRGYLRLYFEGYRSDICQNIKITLPTERKAPSFKLIRTTDTFKKGSDSQVIELQLVDKKKQPVDLSDGGYTLETYINESDSYYSPIEESGQIEIDSDGKFNLTLLPYVTRGGKVRLRLRNESLWADKEKAEFTYTIKMVDSVPKISLTDSPDSTTSLKDSTITLNPNYPQQTVEFGLKSNQQGIMVAEEQIFTPKSPGKKAAEYEKLEVEYTNGIGSVTIKEADIADGTYTYVCDKAQYVFQDDLRPANKVTLKVKIKKRNPTLAVKGSMSLNNQAQTEEGDFVEKSEITLTTKNLPDGYEFDISSTTIECITRNKTGYEEYFEWEFIDRQIGEDGKITEARLVASMNRYVEKGSYKFRMTPVYIGAGEALSAKPVTFTIKIHEGELGVSLAAKGKLNLLDRSESCTATNSIVYTPSLKNIKDKVLEARVFDYTGSVPDYGGEESEWFEARVLSDGKIYVKPKDDAALENNKTYKVWIWMELENYKVPQSKGGSGGGMFCEKVLSIKTAQILPKVTTDKSTVNLYLSNKEYVATFVVEKKDAKAIGNVESIAFGEKDTNAQESFMTTMDENTGKNTVIESEQLSDGSLEVKLKLRDTVHYGCNTTNKLTMYVRFEGQGTNTPGTAITMNVKINK